MKEIGPGGHRWRPLDPPMEYFTWTIFLISDLTISFRSVAMDVDCCVLLLWLLSCCCVLLLWLLGCCCVLLLWLLGCCCVLLLWFLWVVAMVATSRGSAVLALFSSVLALFSSLLTAAPLQRKMEKYVIAITRMHSSRMHTSRSLPYVGSHWQRPLWTENPPGQRHTPLNRATPPGQRPPDRDPTQQRPLWTETSPWTETPLDRAPLDRDTPLDRATPSGQRPLDRRQRTPPPRLDRDPLLDIDPSLDRNPPLDRDRPLWTDKQL